MHLIRLTVPSSHAAVCLLRQLGASKNKRRAAGSEVHSGMDVKGCNLEGLQEEKLHLITVLGCVPCTKDSMSN